MSVGETLQQERLRLGIDLESLSQDTRIRRQYLEAIEADQPEGCPGRFFYRSFVRQYAQAVGLNPDEVEAGIRDTPATSDVHENTGAPERFPLRSPDGILTKSNRVDSSRGGKVWGSVAALAAVIIGGALLYSRFSGHQADRVRPPQQVAATAGQAPPAKTPPVQAAAPVAVAPAPGSQPVSTVPAPTPEEVTVTVKATATAWISMVAEGQNPVIATLKPGEEKTVAARDIVRLRTGNAGGIEISLNGKPIGPIGRSGQIRTVVFTAQGFHIVQSSDEDGAGPEAAVDTAARLSRPL
jgi:cytoskeleton protein RodZ